MVKSAYGLLVLFKPTVIYEKSYQQACHLLLTTNSVDSLSNIFISFNLACHNGMCFSTSKFSQLHENIYMNNISICISVSFCYSTAYMYFCKIPKKRLELVYLLLQYVVSIFISHTTFRMLEPFYNIEID